MGTTGATGADGESAFDAAVAGGYTGTEAQFNEGLAGINQVILSFTIRHNEVLTMANYQGLVLMSQVDPETAYDIIEELV